MASLAVTSKDVREWLPRVSRDPLSTCSSPVGSLPGVGSALFSGSVRLWTRGQEGIPQGVVVRFTWARLGSWLSMCHDAAS